MPDKKILPFKDVPIGAKIRFHEHKAEHVRKMIYTRVADKGYSQTLLFRRRGRVFYAAVSADSNTLVEVLEEAK